MVGLPTCQNNVYCEIFTKINKWFIAFIVCLMPYECIMILAFHCTAACIEMYLISSAAVLLTDMDMLPNKVVTVNCKIIGNMISIKYRLSGKEVYSSQQNTTLFNPFITVCSCLKE